MAITFIVDLYYNHYYIKIVINYINIKALIVTFMLIVTIIIALIIIINNMN